MPMFKNKTVIQTLRRELEASRAETRTARAKAESLARELDALRARVAELE